MDDVYAELYRLKKARGMSFSQILRELVKEHEKESRNIISFAGAIEDGDIDKKARSNFKKAYERDEGIQIEKICLDTGVVFDFLKGEQTVVEKLKYYAAREDICITSFTLLQLLSTIKKPEIVFSFVNSLNILDFDKKAATIAAKIFQELNEKRMKTGIESIVTASICIKDNSFLFTKSRKKFEGIRGLKLV